MSTLTVAHVKAFAELHDTFTKTVAELEAEIRGDGGLFVYAFPTCPTLGIAYGRGRAGISAPAVVGIQNARVVDHAEDGLEFTNGNGEKAEFMPRIDALRAALTEAKRHVGTVEAAIAKYSTEG